MMQSIISIVITSYSIHYTKLYEANAVAAESYTITGLTDEDDEPDPQDSGLTSQGDHIWYFQVGNTIQAWTTTDDADPVMDGRLIFTFAVDASSGEATFNLNDQIDHDDASGDDVSLIV